MNILDRHILLWIGGILLSAGSIVFVMWQLGWVTPMNGLNLELIALWIDFGILLALYNKSRMWAVNLTGINIIPLAAAAMIVFLLHGRTDQIQLISLVEGLIIILGLMSTILYASVMDFLHQPMETLATS